MGIKCENLRMNFARSITVQIMRLLRLKLTIGCNEDCMKGVCVTIPRVTGESRTARVRSRNVLRKVSTKIWVLSCIGVGSVAAVEC